VPDQPLGWLVQTASRRLIDAWRSDRARGERELLAARRELPPAKGPEEDDTLALLFMCCHPSLTPASAIPLTLRAVGGLATAEIARAFLVPESTMAQRISRAKARIRDSGVSFRMPDIEERPARLRSVLHVLYLIFNEGYTSTVGSQLHRVELSNEAIRLTRMLSRLMADDGEVTGLLALMLLIDARRVARTDADADIVPLPEQDRMRWDRTTISEGLALLDAAQRSGPLGEYGVQAAIAAVHDLAPTAEGTDWGRIESLYASLEAMTANPFVTLNRAVAMAMVSGPAVALQAIERVQDRLRGSHRLHAVRAHLLEMAGDRKGAWIEYREAARRTMSLPERRHLTMRAARLRRDSD
jgi:predicted RNA polymerase sigma factor